MDLHQIRHVTVVGLCNADNGRTCGKHLICGQTVVIGTVVRFLVTVVCRNGAMEYAIGAYWIDKGSTNCLVGFLPAACVIDWEMFEDQIGQVIRISRNSTSYGSCNVAILPKRIGWHHEHYKPDLPDLKDKIVEPEHVAMFYGNKDAVKYIKYHKHEEYVGHEDAEELNEDED
jgi:hypothetical protein